VESIIPFSLIVLVDPTKAVTLTEPERMSALFFHFRLSNMKFYR
jgi:hypothetical protein